MPRYSLPEPVSEIENDPWELSQYEKHRRPHEKITDNTEIAVPAKELLEELSCPICLDLLTNTMTTKECLHRFCNECIVTALRYGNKECPKCRAKVPSKRSLRPDPNFDELVRVIFPNREEYEMHQKRKAATESKIRAQNAETIISGMQSQSKSTRKRKDNDTESSHNRNDNEENSTPSSKSRSKSKHASNSNTTEPKQEEIANNNSSQSSSATDVAGQPTSTESNDKNVDLNSNTVETPTEIEILFQLHPNMLLESNDENMKEVVNLMKSNSTRNIKTTSKALVEHLCKYLSMRISIDLANAPGSPYKSKNVKDQVVKDLTIYIVTTTGQPLTPLTTYLSLSQIYEKHWKVNKPMELFYSFERAL